MAFHVERPTRASQAHLFHLKPDGPYPLRSSLRPGLRTRVDIRAPGGESPILDRRGSRTRAALTHELLAVCNLVEMAITKSAREGAHFGAVSGDGGQAPQVCASEHFPETRDRRCPLVAGACLDSKQVAVTASNDLPTPEQGNRVHGRRQRQEAGSWLETVRRDVSRGTWRLKEKLEGTLKYEARVSSAAEAIRPQIRYEAGNCSYLAVWRCYSSNSKDARQ